MSARWPASCAAEELPDGRWILGAIGIHRIRVERWLTDDPYPRAEIHEWAEQLQEPAEAGEGTTDDRDEVTTLLRRAAALRREMGEPAPPLDLELADDPVVAGYQATVVAPLGPADRQALLAAPTVPARWRLLRGCSSIRSTCSRRASPPDSADPTRVANVRV